MVNPLSIAMKPGIDVIGCFAATASVVKEQERSAATVRRLIPGFDRYHSTATIADAIIGGKCARPVIASNQIARADVMCGHRREPPTQRRQLSEFTFAATQRPSAWPLRLPD